MRYRVLALAALALLLPSWETKATPLGLPPDHVARLHQGEIVLLDVLPPGGDAGPVSGATATALVHASPEAIWRILTDYPGHRHLYPRVVDAEVLEVEATHVLVRYVVGVGPFSFGFHVRSYADPDRHRIDWRLAHERPNALFRESWGYWQLEPTSAGVLLTYAMAGRTVLPAFLTRGAERDGVRETLRAVRARAERGA
jgi:ribosome-associated toxin RatA of RatAB toxin-antitoxin module